MTFAHFGHYQIPSAREGFGGGQGESVTWYLWAPLAHTCLTFGKAGDTYYYSCDGIVNFGVKIINILGAREHFGGGLWLTCHTYGFSKSCKFQWLEKVLESVRAIP